MLRILALIAFFLLLSHSSGFAASTYMLQLGSAPNNEEAETLYKQSLEEHGELIGEYGYAPRESKKAAPEKRVRVQVGPVETRREANKVCSSLRNSGSTCFVVETSAKVSTKAIARTQEVIAAKEAATENKPEPELNPAAVADNKETKSFWDFLETKEESEQKEEEKPKKEANDLFEDEPTKTVEKPEEKPKKSSKRININTASVRVAEASSNTPEIDVAEAISSLFGGDSEKKPEEPKVAENSERKIELIEEPIAKTTETAEVALQKLPLRSGDVEVAEAIPVPLSDDITKEEAMPKLKVVNDENAVKAKTFSEPENKKSKKLNLQIGMFTDGPSAMTCWDTIVTADPSLKKLRARAVMGMASSVGLPSSWLEVTAKDDVKNRICTLSNGCGDNITCRKAETEKQQLVIPEQNTASPATGGHWVQLGSFPSYAHAQSRFEEIKEAQGSLLTGYEAAIRAPENVRSRTYRLRVGPFENLQDADSLCWKLAARGVDCVAISE